MKERFAKFKSNNPSNGKYPFENQDIIVLEPVIIVVTQPGREDKEFDRQLKEMKIKYTYDKPLGKQDIK